MRSLSQEIAARATAAKFGGESPDVRALARDLLEVIAENDELRDRLAVIRHADDCTCGDCYVAAMGGGR